MEHESDGYSNCNWRTRYSKGAGELANKRTSGDNPDYSIVEIIRNTKEGPGDLRRIAVTQTPVEDHQQTPV